MDTAGISRLGSGSQADVFLYQGAAYKCFHTPDKRAEAFWESFATSVAEATGLPVPHIHRVFERNGCPIIHMDYAPGISLNARLKQAAKSISFSADLGTAPDIRQLIDLLITTQDRIHNAQIALPLSLKALLRQKIEAVSLLSPQQQASVLARLDRLPAGKDCCHGDFHGDNVMVADNGSVTVIDWPNLSVGCRLADVCRTYLLYRLHYPGLADVYLERYVRRFGANRHEILQWLPVLAASRLTEQAVNFNEDEQNQLLSWSQII